jgi:asparagine synthase (glutamine-hydrolysing)
MQPELDREAFVDFLSLNYVPGESTMIEGVQSVRPGTVLSFREDHVEEAVYWTGQPDAERMTAAERQERLSALIDDSVRLRLRSDVPVGLFLSGGIDSTTVACSLARQANNVVALIARFPEEGFSEAANAISVCEHLGLPYEAVDIDPAQHDLPTLIESLVLHGDEPLADSSALPVFLLSQAAAERVKVVLSGDGGDELFAGYLTYRATRIARRLGRPLRSAAHAFHGLLPRASDRAGKVGLHEKLDRFLRSMDLSPGAAHFAWNGMFDADDKRLLVHPDVITAGASCDTFEKLRERWDVSAARPGLTELLLADQREYLANDILAKTDRMSMAHGLEVRPALLDHRIVELARATPEEKLLRGRVGKVLVRRHLAERAPWYPLSLPKQGFSIPIHPWLRTLLRDYVGDLFGSKWVAESGLYDAGQLLRLWEQHCSGKRTLGFELWGVMVSLLWFRRFLGSPDACGGTP